ncbi:hypothetical protein [Streptomyces sp. NPDC058330]|uniref:hypothetical protein n=1 Tax=Streptomyces sp. NPDC058330 TaxID=3346449 RepID=UPI0036EE8EB9
MSDDKPIALEGIPVFTGNLATLDVKVTELTSAAETIATTTGDVHSSFGGLQAFYQAPEAEQLFATTKPVVDTGQKMKSDLTTISRALSTYSDEVYPLVEKLKEIKRDAGAFLVKINADDKWREDGDLIDENNHRRDEIADALAAFQDAEITCHNKIVALVCGVPLKKSDGSDSAHQYGFDAETYKHAEGLPWGDPLVESIPGWQVWEHAWEFTKGFFVDGVWGTIKGLGTLVGFDGFDAAGQAWKGLAQLATGVAISLSPVAAVQFWTADEKDMPGWLRDSRNAVKETGKALVAWDQWGDNPSRAAGAVTFNVVTTVFTGGTGAAASGAGKTALAAKALSAAGKVGRIVDPMTYVFKGAGVGLSKIGDVMAGLKGLGKIEIPPLPDNVFTLPDGWTRLPDGTLDVPAGATLPEGATRLPDGAVKLPEGTIALPPNTLKSPFDEGSAYADIDGNLYDEHGNLVEKGANARKELSETADTNTPDHTHLETPARQPVLVGAGARGGSNIGDGIRPGDGLRDAGRVSDELHDGRVDDLARSPAASHDPSTSGHGERAGSSGGSEGSVGGDRTPRSGGDHVPSGSGADGPELGRSSDGAGETGTGYTPSHGGGWGGAGWVEQPSDYAAGIYDTLRATPNHIDIPAMARNTGLDESVLRQVKTHMIRSQHDVIVRPGEWVRGRFTPRDDIARLWDGARRGTLNKAQVKEFRNLMTHEYVESRLMKAGLPYLQDQAGLWRKEADGTYADGGRYSPKSLSAAGAHDLAPNPVRGGFGTAWQKLGLRHPETELAADLSNIDDFVKDVFHELRAKGLNLK